MKTPSSRKALVVLVVLTLATAAASAEPLSGTWSHPTRIVSSFSMDSFARLWSVLTGLWTKNGCSVDPDGRCLPGSSSTVTTDNGCQVDPSGRCLPGKRAMRVTPKNGCELDPNGRCFSGPSATTNLDNGCSLDPNGRCVK